MPTLTDYITLTVPSLLNFCTRLHGYLFPPLPTPLTHPLETLLAQYRSLPPGTTPPAPLTSSISQHLSLLHNTFSTLPSVINVRNQLAPNGVPPLPTTASLTAELEALPANFSLVRYTPTHITVRTPPILLDAPDAPTPLDFGPFNLQLNLVPYEYPSSRTQFNHSSLLCLYALRPLRANPREPDNYFHPNVHTITLCLGEGRDAFLRQLASGDIIEAFHTCLAVLRGYDHENPNNPFRTIDYWQRLYALSTFPPYIRGTRRTPLQSIGDGHSYHPSQLVLCWDGVLRRRSSCSPSDLNPRCHDGRRNWYPTTSLLMCTRCSRRGTPSTLRNNLCTRCFRQLESTP